MPDAPSSHAVEPFGKKRPFPAELLRTQLLNGPGSTKETLHLELSLEGSGMTYEPGDALAVHPVNAPDEVAAVLAAAGCSGTETIEPKGGAARPLADALREDFDITGLSRAVLTKLAEATGSEELRSLLGEERKDDLKDYVDGRRIVDALTDFAPGGLAADRLAGMFRKLPPRLYSIASSPLAHPGEVHLTVAAVRYRSHGRERKGVCSTYLADLVRPGDPVRVFTQPNKNFRLPADPATPVILIGPGTGVAPFRAFVEHRAALGQPGLAWLFMGDQHASCDFLYEAEWRGHLESGALTRLDAAFSRDQPEKIYVQHRMLEHAAELHAWIVRGAAVYVCGDAARMAVDVHEALLTIVERQGGLSREAAVAFMDDLKRGGRYQRDVY